MSSSFTKRSIGAFWLIAALLCSAIACKSSSSTNVEAQNSKSDAPAGDKTDSHAAHELVARGAKLVDVRTPEEFAEGHIEGATNIPLDELPIRAEEIKPSKVVVVYCQSGRRSAKAAQLLSKEGFEVHDLGPMSSWQE